MRRRRHVWLFACATCTWIAACKVEISPGAGLQPDGATPGDAARDGDVVDAPPDAAPLGPWGTPQLIPGANSTTLVEDDGSMSSTRLELVFSRVDANSNTKDLFAMRRAAVTDPWGAPTRLAINTTDISDETPRLSADNLTLYFASGRAGGLGGLDIWRSVRPAVDQPWGTPTLVTGVSTTGADKWFTPCAKDNATYVTIVGLDIGEGTLGAPPTVNATLSSANGTETGTYLSPDCLTIFFASTRSGTNQIYTATRPAIGGAWTTPTRVATFDALGGAQEDPWISADNRTFVFVSDIAGTKDVYVSTR